MCAKSTFFLPQLFATKVTATYSKPHMNYTIEKIEDEYVTSTPNDLYIPNELNSERAEFKVLNVAETPFGKSEIAGTAVTLDGVGYRNRVSFGPFFDFFSHSPWYGNYAVIDFDQRDRVCEWVIVGDLDYRYLWFLYRMKNKVSPEKTKEIVQNQIEVMESIARAFGYTEAQIRGMVSYI